ncbi:hypothetical protein CBS9595_001457 [Malassezia furfur]|nr:hypothetical protein CBS9595_001457 [Malassezia furfur]
MPTTGGGDADASASHVSMDTGEPLVGDFPAPGTGPFARHELVRVLLQSLRDLGLQETARALQHESHVDLEAPVIAAFRTAVLRGNWDAAEHELGRAASDASIHISAPPSGALSDDPPSPSASSAHAQGIAYIRFQLHEQQYLELLESGQIPSALRILRERLAPLAPRAQRLQVLSSLVLCADVNELYTRANWDGARGTSRRALLDRIERVVDSASMLPNGRLIHLLEQAVAFQRLQDPYYSADTTRTTPPSLLTDFAGDPQHFPRHNSHVLQGHADEVWTLRFSPSGRLLATAGRDRIVTVWDVDDHFAVRARLEHRDPVASIDFSPDEQQLVVASEEEVTLWDLDTKHGATFVEHQHTVSTVRFLPAPKHASSSQRAAAFVSGAMDHAMLFWDAQGNVVARHDLGPYRVTSLDVSPDGRTLVAVAWQPPPAKAMTSPDGFARGGRMRRGTSDDSVMTLLPLSLTGGAFIPYDIRHYSGIAGTRAAGLDLLNFPNEQPDERPGTRRARQALERTCDALEGRADDAEASRSSDASAHTERSRILVFDLTTQRETGSLYVPETLDHVAISPDSQSALLSGIGCDVILLNIASRTLQQRYHGHKADEFVIRATFGGHGEQLAGGLGAPFVVSGSEDAQIYFWHRASGRLIESSCRHAHGAVNDIAWRPQHDAVMASCGDDGTVRIWQPTMPSKESVHYATEQEPIMPIRRTGTYAADDWKRPYEEKEVPMDDGADDGGTPEPGPVNLNLGAGAGASAARRAELHADVRPIPPGRIRPPTSPEHEPLASSSPPAARPPLLPW